jgi:hypothetical protein
MKFIILTLLIGSWISVSQTAAAQDDLRLLETMSPGTKITWRFPIVVHGNMPKVELKGLIDVKGVGSNTVSKYNTFLSEFRNGWWYVPAEIEPTRRSIAGTMIVDYSGYDVNWEPYESPAVIVTTTYTIVMTSGEKLTCDRTRVGLFDRSISPMYFDDFVATTSPIFSSIIEP